MTSRTRAAANGPFESDELYTPGEIAERLKATQRQVRRWVDERRFPDGGVLDLPRGRRIYGWALNDFVAARTLGA